MNYLCSIIKNKYIFTNMKFDKSIEELKKLAVDACEAYEAGEPIMSDEEYDELRMYRLHLP